MAKSVPDAIVQTLQHQIFMQVLLAVVDDLYTFAVSMLFPWRENTRDTHRPLYLPEPRVVSPEKIEEDVRSQKAMDVYPAFIIGAENSAREATTVRLRLVIRDEFSTILSQLPLQAHEYVYYKLLRHGVHVAWPDIRPRTPGSWAKILSLLAGVTVGDIPTVGSVMEFSVSEGRAHLAYVEEVFPDQTIKISEADWPERGIYNERILTAEEWHALHAVFIAIC